MENPKKILLATADENLVICCKKALNRYDVTLVCENNYNNAIETLQQENFDLLITDYFLFADGKSRSIRLILSRNGHAGKRYQAVDTIKG